MGLRVLLRLLGEAAGSLPGSLARCPSSTLLPFFFWVPLLKPNSRKKGTLIIKGLLGNLVRHATPDSICCMLA